MTFSPGDPVICTDASHQYMDPPSMLSVNRLVEGNHYTISEVRDGPLGLGVKLKEVAAFYPRDLFRATRFRALNRAPESLRRLLEVVPA